MPTQRKIQIVESLTEKLRRAKTTVLVQAQGMSVAEQTEMRKKFRSSGLDFQVVKNTLLRHATHSADTANIDDVLSGPTAIVIGYQDEVGVAKAVLDYIRTSKTVTVKAGMLGKQKLNPAQLESLSKLPGRDQLRSQAVGTVQGPLATAAGLVAAPLRDLVQILHNYAEKQGATF